jgi:hypothetical protein
VIRRLVWINLGLVALQASSAGFFLSGYSRAAGVHRVVAHALQFGALAQAVTAVVLWRKRRVPARLAGVGIGLFVMVFLEVALGYRSWHWLHVPIGVGLFTGLTRQVSGLKERVRLRTEEQS